MTEINKIWDVAVHSLKDTLGEIVVQTWILPLKALDGGIDEIILEAPDGFFRNWVDKHHKQAIKETLKKISGREIKLTLETAVKQESAELVNSPELRKAKTTQNQDYGIILNPRYTFENFVVGPANLHSHAYSVAVAKSPAKTYNPLFIYGGVGLGKTHLIQAICHHIKGQQPQLKICYITSERFTNELIDSIQHRSTNGFRQKYRSLDLLVIDDIHFIAGKESTQEEFFHTFNTLYDAHKQIIICSDRPPKEIANLQERLVSRFNWGLATDIQPPDLETRVAILKKKIEREPVNIPDDVIFFIAQLIKTNIRELEGALVRVIAYSLLEEKPITIDLAREILKDLLKEPKKLLTVDFIQRCVVEEYGVAMHDLKMKRRNKNIVLPRQIAMYLSRELTDLSLPEIGGLFGGKDHTTVLHSYNKIKEAVKHNPGLKDRINKITQVIQE
ncbi:MAG: chromosomal replication initiator protein DnaA [Candidatus Omnitrophota bacterium]|nr:chromosomal replication initiator protein DnaA [Candidatus Omnitrophota bacterium]